MTKVAFLVNGGYESAMGQRARSFASHLANRYDIRIAYRSRRKLLSLARFAGFLIRNRPAVTYVFDMAYSGVVSALLYKAIARNALIIDTGDSISALARSMGRGRVGLWVTDRLESLSFRYANRIVVRGSFHRDLLQKNHIPAELIRDGVNAEEFAPRDASELRRKSGVEGVFTVGMVGNSVWSEKLQMCYGWDLVDAISLLRGLPVKGVFIGDGSGIDHLKRRCREYGIEDKVLFLGFVPYETLPLHLSMLDVCLSTQTNDIVGKVRTTGKLPLYLASGRYILASKVGEAALVLDDEMLVEYDGVKDSLYPMKLAQRICRLLDHQAAVQPSARNMALAREQFDYSVLSQRVASAIECVLHAEDGKSRLQDGHYARKQIFSKDWLVSWSHRKRFEAGLRLARTLSGKRVLDYGCGDGSFLGMLMQSADRPSEAFGAELRPEVAQECRERFADVSGLSFLTIAELAGAEHRNRYDAIVCTEVLEHVVDVDPVLDRFAELLAPGGMLIVSVPVETGLPLLLKQAVRRIAGWRGIGDYPGQSPYTLRDYWASLVPGPKQHIVRPIHVEPNGTRSHDHKGFNWRVLERALATRFDIDQKLGSPFAWLSPAFATQVWFIAHSK
jgi:glycosyltransferase involved in cell wall biosynthesis/SAM-dependent methyltransferase